MLRHDAQEQNRLTSVEEFDGGRKRAPVVYGRRVGGRFVQYWLLYDYNSQDRGIVRTGRHEGDWEMVQLELGGGGVAGATFTQHSSAERCAASELEFEGDHPVVYVANGSHALYPRAGVHDRPWPDPNDEAQGDGAEQRPRVDRFGDWLDRQERWGDSDAGWVPGEQPSPPGPAFQGVRWDEPRAFSESARACGELPARFPWPLLAAGVVLTGVALRILVRRRG